MATEKELIDLVRSAQAIFSECAVEIGYCCCGDNMNGHSSPMDCGHTPVDAGGYAAMVWLDQFKKAFPDG